MSNPVEEARDHICPSDIEFRITCGQLITDLLARLDAIKAIAEQNTDDHGDVSHIIALCDGTEAIRKARGDNA